MWQRSAVGRHADIRTWFFPSHPSPSLRGLLFYSGSSASSCEIKRQRICRGWWISVTSCHFQKCHRLFCLFSTGQNSVTWSHFAAEALFFKKKKRKSMDFCLSHHLSSSSYPRNTQTPSPRESIQSHIYVIYQSPRSPGNIIYCPLFSLSWSILPCVFNSLFMSLVWILSCLIFAACFL